MNSESEDEIPQDILEEANTVSLNLLPIKSREKYEKEYQLLKRWMETMQIKKLSEEAVLVYFSRNCASLKPPTLWSKYSMLRSTLQIKDNVDIKYPKLIAFLKRKSAGYKAKKANTFSREDVNKFIAEAPDETYLHMKVVLLFGIAGACRTVERGNVDRWTLADFKNYDFLRPTLYVYIVNILFFLENILIWLWAPTRWKKDQKVIANVCECPGFPILRSTVCRCDELVKMVLDDISGKGDILVVRIPDSKTNIKRTFTITNEILDGVSILDMYRKYLACLSHKTDHPRFFVNYVKGKCTVQVIGKNTMANIPYRIATFLNLDDAKGYTGHSLRRTLATLLVNAGGDMLTLKRHGGWRTNVVAEGYLDECISKKCEGASQIITGENTTLSAKKRLIVIKNSASSSLSASQEITLENNQQESISTSRATTSLGGISSI